MKTVFLKLTSVVRVLLTVSDRLGVALWQHEASLCFQDSGKHTRLSLWMEINVNVSLLWLLYYTAVKEGGGSKWMAGQWTRIVDCRAQPAVGSCCFMLVREENVNLLLEIMWLWTDRKSWCWPEPAGFWTSSSSTICSVFVLSPAHQQRGRIEALTACPVCSKLTIVCYLAIRKLKNPEVTWWHEMVSTQNLHLQQAKCSVTRLVFK